MRLIMHIVQIPILQNSFAKDELERDKRWIEGLDKIHRSRNIMKCFDFSATPFPPGEKTISEDMLFGWIVSDFSLNDAIESGLTKTPRIAIRDDSDKFDANYRSRFYHIYRDDEVKPDLNRRAKDHMKNYRILSPMHIGFWVKIGLRPERNGMKHTKRVDSRDRQFLL